MIDSESATPMQRRVRKAAEEYGQPLFLRTEVAAELGVTVTTVKRWASIWQGAAPSVALKISPKMIVHLYTAADVAACEQARDYYSTAYRRAKWSSEQRAERQRLASMRSYYRRARRLHQAEGNLAAESAAAVKVAEYETALESMVPRGADAGEYSAVP